jgi:hypothetical protein
MTTSSSVYSATMADSSLSPLCELLDPPSPVADPPPELFSSLPFVTVPLLVTVTTAVLLLRAFESDLLWAGRAGLESVGLAA